MLDMHYVQSHGDKNKDVHWEKTSPDMVCVCWQRRWRAGQGRSSKDVKIERRKGRGGKIVTVPLLYSKKHGFIFFYNGEPMVIL